jgi:hypothetical protein
MLAAIVLAVIAAIVVPVELARRPFRSIWSWICRWCRLIRQLPRLDQAVESIAWMIAHDEADYGSTDEEHQQAIQDLHDYLTGRRDASGLRRRPRTFH